MKKHLAVAGVATIIGTASLAGATVLAHDGGASGNSNFAQALAERFNLNQSDVESFLDDQHKEREAEREQRIASDIKQLVTDGKLTQDQADKLTAKRAELIKARQQARDTNDGERPSRDDMRQRMQTERADLQQWASDNGIDQQYLRYVIGHGGRGEIGRHGDMRGDRNERSERGERNDQPSSQPNDDN